MFNFCMDRGAGHQLEDVRHAPTGPGAGRSRGSSRRSGCTSATASSGSSGWPRTRRPGTTPQRDVPPWYLRTMNIFGRPGSAGTALYRRSGSRGGTTTRCAAPSPTRSRHWSAAGLAAARLAAELGPPTRGGADPGLTRPARSAVLLLLPIQCAAWKACPPPDPMRSLPEHRLRQLRRQLQGRRGRRRARLPLAHVRPEMYGRCTDDAPPGASGPLRPPSERSARQTGQHRAQRRLLRRRTPSGRAPDPAKRRLGDPTARRPHPDRGSWGTTGQDRRGLPGHPVGLLGSMSDKRDSVALLTRRHYSGPVPASDPRVPDRAARAAGRMARLGQEGSAALPSSARRIPASSDPIGRRKVLQVLLVGRDGAGRILGELLGAGLGRAGSPRTGSPWGSARSGPAGTPRGRGRRRPWPRARSPVRGGSAPRCCRDPGGMPPRRPRPQGPTGSAGTRPAPGRTRPGG